MSSQTDDHSVCLVLLRSLMCSSLLTAKTWILSFHKTVAFWCFVAFLHIKCIAPYAHWSCPVKTKKVLLIKQLLFTFKIYTDPTNPYQCVITHSMPASWNSLSYRSGIGINGFILTEGAYLPSLFLPLLLCSKVLQSHDKNVQLLCFMVTYT